MKTLYLDCFAGIAGDMFIGALLNLVPSHKILIDGIAKITGLDKSEYQLVIENANKNGIAGINFDVKLNHEHEHHHRHLADIEAMIYSSGLNERIKREAIRAFSLLAQAEAHVHGTTIDQIHFHEVGAVDSIIDIVGAFILMDALNWPRVLCSSINVGSGVVECAHGILPVPAPATEYLLRGLPVFSSGSPMERATPTGALLVKILADGFCTLPPGKITASGYGLGNRESQDMPNVLRALLIDSDVKDAPEGLIQEKLALIECNIDDMNPQDFELVNEILFKSGALDVWLENIHMKKSRQGVKLCCLCEPSKTSELAKLILINTTSQGVRIHSLDRLRLDWRLEERETSLGKIRVKTTYLNDEIIRRVPEYEDVKALAVRLGRSMWDVRKAIMGEI